MIEDHTLGEPNFVVHAVVSTPVIPGKDSAQYEFGTKIAPERVKDLKQWRVIATAMGLSFYRAFSGDNRGEELVKEFEGSALGRVQTEQQRRDIRERLGILAGQASMCWDRDDIFDSKRASGAVDEAFDVIIEIMNRAKFP